MKKLKSFELLLAGLILLAYHGLYKKTEYVFDERRIIEENQAAWASTSWSLLFSRDFWGGEVTGGASHQSFRPLTTATYKLESLLFGVSFSRFRHFTNLVIHWMVTCFVYRINLRNRVEPITAQFTSTLFALHPLQSEAVISLYGRADLLATLATVAAYAIRKDNFIGSLVLALSGLLAKETGLGGVLLLALAHGIDAHYHQVRPKKMMTVIGVALIAVYFRLAISKFTSPTFSPMDNPLQLLSGAELWLNLVNLPWHLLSLFFFPLRLCHDWSMGAIKPDLITSPHAWFKLTATFCLIGFYFNHLLKRLKCSCCQPAGHISFFMQLMHYPSVSFILEWFALRNRHDFVLVLNEKIKMFEHSVSKPRRNQCHCGHHHRLHQVLRQHLFWAVWMFLFYLPQSHFLVFVGFGAAERCVYPIMVGGAMIIGHLISRRQKVQKIMVLILPILLLRTHIRCSDWKNDLSLSSSGAQIGSLKSQINFAGHLSQKSDFDRSLKILSSVGKQYQTSDLNYNLGLTYQMSGDDANAINAYEKCLAHRETHTHCWLNKAVIFEQKGRDPSEELQKCIQMKVRTRNEHIGQKLCYFNLGRYQVVQKRATSAASTLTKLFEMDLTELPIKTQASIHNLYAESLVLMNRIEEAEDRAGEAISLLPTHYPAHETRTKSRLILGRAQAADIKLLQPNRAGYVLQAAADMQILTEACEGVGNPALKESCGIRARELGGYEKALSWFNQALEKRKSVTALTSVGGIHHLRRDFEKAKLYYEQALELEPDNKLVHSNLNKVIKLLGAV